MHPSMSNWFNASPPLGPYYTSQSDDTPCLNASSHSLTCQETTCKKQTPWPRYVDFFFCETLVGECVLV